MRRFLGCLVHRLVHCVALTVGTTACNVAAPDDVGDSAVQFHLQFGVSGVGPREVEYSIHGVDCEYPDRHGGTAAVAGRRLAPWTGSGAMQVVTINPAALPGKPMQSDARHTLPAGCFRVTFAPRRDDGSSPECDPSSLQAHFKVVARRTTHVSRYVHCVDHAVVGTATRAAANHPPFIERLWFKDSNIVCGGNLTICANAIDPDGDPLELVLSSQDCEPTEGAELTQGGQCWAVRCHRAGRLEMVVRAYDLLKTRGGTLRIEDWLKLEGQSTQSHATLEFPVRIIGQQRWPDRDADNYGDATAAARVFCNADDTEGFVDNNDDCNDLDPLNPLGLGSPCAGKTPVP